MTLSELLKCSADELEKMSDADLLKHFEQYLVVTRPERARAAAPKKNNEPAVYVSPGKKRAFAALENMGVDLSLFDKRKRKK